MTISQLYKGVPITDKKTILKVSNDNLLAYVTGHTQDNYRTICKNLPGLFEKYGIIHGVKKIPEPLGDKLIVAKGTPPKDGKDGGIEIIAKSWLQAKKSDKKNKSDIRNLNLIKNVSKGEVIARRIPPTKGTDGMDIFGNKIPAKPGEWKSFNPGDCVEIVDENTLVASEDGALHIDEKGTISVKTEWDIRGDVGWSTGHVEFYGKKLSIEGSVLGGFTVECPGDVTIGKNIEDESVVFCGGNLTVNGIIRSQHTIVKTGGDLHCNMVEYARLFVGNNMKVNEYILNGDCQVHGDVEVFTGKGLIAGGKVFMRGSLKAKYIGTTANVLTRIGAGFDPTLMTHYKAYIKEQEELSTKMDKIKQGLEKIKTIEEKRGKLKNNLLILKKTLEQAVSDIVFKWHDNIERLRKIEEQLGQMKHATITVLGTVHANTIIKIFSASLHLKKDVQQIVFHYKKGEIIATELQ